MRRLSQNGCTCSTFFLWCVFSSCSLSVCVSLFRRARSAVCSHVHFSITTATITTAIIIIITFSILVLLPKWHTVVHWLNTKIGISNQKNNFIIGSSVAKHIYRYVSGEWSGIEFLGWCGVWFCSQKSEFPPYAGGMDGHSEVNAMQFNDVDCIQRVAWDWK